MINIEKDGDLYLVTMSDGDNKICSDWQDRMLSILDTMEASRGAGTAMVLTGEGKFFSNGLYLENLKQLDEAGRAVFGRKMEEIHRRLLMLPFPTVAAVNGHAFAGGAFVALSCDYRIMREDRGWICFSEVDAGVPIANQMIEILRGKLPPNTVRDALLIGKRYTADEAIVSGLVDAKAPMDELFTAAKDLATNLATKEPGIFQSIKQTYIGPIVEGLQ